MTFLVAEAHPFSDGNGRLARVIPTIYRANYLAVLKAISNRADVEPLIRALDFAQRFTHAIGRRNFARAETELREAKAFMDSAEAEEQGIRLRIPST